MASVANRFAIQVAIASDLANIFEALKPNDIRKVRSDELTANEIAKLNNKIVGNSFACFVQCTRENLEALAGIRLCTEQEAPQVTIGGKGYVFDRNKQNRPLQTSRVLPVTKEGTYSNLVARGLWGSLAGVLLFTDEGQIASAQHSIAGFLGALDNGQDLESLFVLCVFGLPPQYRDFSDKGRARNKTQDSFIDENLFGDDILELYQAEQTPPGKEKEKERIELIKLHSKIASNVLARSTGKDISRTGDKLTWANEKAFASRFENPTDLQVLSIKLWEACKSQSGKADRLWCKELFAPSVVGACLILASNSQDKIEAKIALEVTRGQEETPEDFAQRKLETRQAFLAQDSKLEIDWSLVDTVLSLLEQTSDNAGPLVDTFKDLLKRKADDKKSADNKDYLYNPTSKPAISACVQLVKNIGGKESFGDAEALESSVWTTYRKDAKTGAYPSTYRYFGGLDCGFINQRKGKAKDE
jgi:hypothetical protein